MSTWIVDAGPLIFLAKLGRLDLLQQADMVCIPQAVYNEIQQYDDAAAATIAHIARSWLKVRVVQNQQEAQALLTDLDVGEAEVIALAKEIEPDRLILDDMDARRIARRHGFSMTGTVGLLLAARLRNEIPSLRTELDRLKAVGFWINPKLEMAVLGEAGEANDEIQ
jgi:predicted nucleic acid-binding protein